MTWIIADTETSGLGDEARIVEVALVEVDEHLNVKRSAYSLIDPLVPISPSASGIHGITNALVVNEPTIEEFFEGVGSEFAEMSGSILVCHNVAFDKKYLAPHIPFSQTLCTLKLSRLVFPDSPDHKLQTLRYLLGLKGGKSHSAMGDVEVLLELVEALMATSGHDLHGLLDLAQQKIVVKEMPFGKHKGTRLENLPRNYVKWLFGLDNLDDNLKYSLDLLFNS